MYRSSQNGWAFYSDGASPTICLGNHGGCAPRIIETYEKTMDIKNKKKLESMKSFHRFDLEKYDYRIRNLTPRECWRLMGVKDEDIDKVLAAGVSNTQMYNMAGNSIITNCMSAIFTRLFVDKTCDIDEEEKPATITLF